MRKIDLHLHSYYSDGYLSPARLFAKAKKNGHQVVSLTDHNGVSGLLEAKAIAKNLHLKFINGIEFYCVYKKKTDSYFGL